jgi:YVTN family beta-propeller protein
VFSRDGQLLYVSGETAGDLTVIDTTTRAIVGRLVHGGGDAMGLALTADGKTLYAGAGENKAVLKIDTATTKQVGAIAMPGVVHETTLTLDGKHLYVTLRKLNKVVIVSTAGYPDLVTMEPSGRYAFVTNRYADAVFVIDVATHKEIRRIPVGKAPHGMALRPEGAAYGRAHVGATAPHLTAQPSKTASPPPAPEGLAPAKPALGAATSPRR